MSRSCSARTNRIPSSRTAVGTSRAATGSAALLAALGLFAAACSTDTSADTGSEEPAVDIGGVADDVVDGTESGYNTDDLNVPGTETDAEVDRAERLD